MERNIRYTSISRITTASCDGTKTSNKALQPTATRCASSFYHDQNSSGVFEPRSREPAAELSLVRRMSVALTAFTYTKRMILFGILIPWSVAMIIGVTGAADHSRLFSTIGVIAVMLLMSAIGCVYLFAFRCRRCRKSLAMIKPRRFVIPARRPLLPVLRVRPGARDRCSAKRLTNRCSRRLPAVQSHFS